MTILNGTHIIDRNNRPGVLQRVALRALFINNGVLSDPVQVSSVTLFSKAHNTSPSSVLNDDNVINASSVSGSVVMHWAPPASGGPDSGNASFNPNQYAPGEQKSASSIFRLRAGDYVVVLDGTIDVSASLSSLTGKHDTIQNTASSIKDYIDVWTVLHVAGSKPTTHVNSLRLFDDSFVMVTQPLMLSPRASLVRKRMRLGEVVDLKVANQITVQNPDLDDSIRNLFDQSLITSAMVQIEKINEEDSLPNHVTVSGYGDTSATVEVTSDDTIIFNWDTNILKTWGTVAAERTKREEIGSPTGTFSVRVKYTLLNETIISPRLFFTIT